MRKTKTTSPSTSDLLPKHQTSEIYLKTSDLMLKQNRRQKVFNRGVLRFCCGALGLCGGLDILKINKNSTDL